MKSGFVLSWLVSRSGLCIFTFMVRPMISISTWIMVGVVKMPRYGLYKDRHRNYGLDFELKYAFYNVMGIYNEKISAYDTNTCNCHFTILVGPHCDFFFNIMYIYSLSTRWSFLIYLPIILRLCFAHFWFAMVFTVWLIVIICVWTVAISKTVAIRSTLQYSLDSKVINVYICHMSSSHSSYYNNSLPKHSKGQRQC